MTPRKVPRFLPTTRVSIPIKYTTTSIRKTPPKSRRTEVATTCLMVDDDPPRKLPAFYKNPVHLVKDGDDIHIWWEGDNTFYPGKARNLRVDGRRRIEYADGQVMYHNLNKELFVFAGAALDRFLSNRFPDAVHDQIGDDPVCYPHLASQIRVGDEVQVYWDEYQAYFSGFVTGMDANGWCSISYEDGDKGSVLIVESAFRFRGMSAARAHSELM